MKILVSPAKKLNYDQETYVLKPTEIQFSEHSQRLINKLQKMDVNEISKLMHLSPKLAELNFDRYQEWSLPFQDDLVKPAAFAFNGEVYTGLDIRSFDKQQLAYAQDNLIILSGLYGVLRPMDKIMPYRLEMGTSLKYSDSIKNLYQFWGDLLTDNLKSSLKDDEVIVNLASKEYSKSLKLKTINNTIITPVFKELKGDSYKVVMMYAKKARGVMSSYLLKNNIQTVEEIKTFDTDGYMYNADLSTDTEFTFTR